jgi:shikimate kinase
VAQELGDTDILVRCLPAAADVAVPGRLRENLVILDASYQPSAFADAARAAGCRFIDGKEWLVHQADASFQLFTESPAPLPTMRSAADRSDRAEGRPLNVALIGFMGAGKSTVGRALARRLGFTLLDVDQRIEEGAGATVRAIFESEGESSFRRRETGELSRLASTRGAVAAVGGGAVLSEENRRILSNHCVVVWLWAPLSTCLARTDAATRPLLAGMPAEQVRALFDERRHLYFKASDIVIDSGSAVPDNIAERIGCEVGFSLGR